MDKLKVLYLVRFAGGHPVFRPLAQALDAREFVVDTKKIRIKNKYLDRILQYLLSIYFSSKIPKGYDVILAEGGMSIASLAKRLRRIKNTKIVGILAGGQFSYAYIKHGKRTKLSYHFMKGIDIFLCPSKYVRDMAKKVFPTQKMIVVYGFPNPNLVRYMKKGTNPKIESKNLLFIGSAENKSRILLKGVDIAVETFKILKQKEPNAKLIIAGRFNKDLIKNWEGINGLKFVESPTNKKLVGLIKKSALYIHLGRDDAFPTSVLDAMYGGLPVVVSDQTGSIDFMSRLDKKLISPLDPNKAAETIEYYFKLGKQEKKRLSNKARIIAHSFKKEDIIKKFIKDLYKALNELNAID